MTDEPYDKDEKVEQAKEIIDKYRGIYKDVDPQVLFRLTELKKITREHKHAAPEKAYKKILHQLDGATSAETLRQERWRGHIRCPYCGSEKIKRLDAKMQKEPTIYKYLCDDCLETFNDDTNSQIEVGIPPLNTWMFCWYLLGCTSSLQFIATKLGLNLATIEMMVRHLQKLFKAEQPLKHFMSFDEWALKHGKSYKTAIKEAIAKQQLLFTGESTTAPKDTREYRKQKDRAQNPDHKNPPGSRPRNTWK